MRIQPETKVYHFFSAALFPSVMIFALWLAWWMYQRDVALGNIVGIGSALAFCFIAVFERLMPFREKWNQGHDDIFTDILHNGLSSYASREIYRIIFLALFASLVGYLAAQNSHGIWQEVFGGLPLIVQLFLVAAIAEFGNYWVHRASHEVEFFWRFHSVHHSPKRLYWLNAGRDHPVSVFFFFVVASVPLILLGVPTEVLALFYVMEAVHGLFQHCNINVRLGPLNWLFSMAELHRWHHSTKISQANNNYGLTLIIWDVVFGTRYLPSRQGPEEIGIESIPNYPGSFVRQMIFPFVWRKHVNAETTETETARDAEQVLTP